MAAATHARGAASLWTPQSDWNPHDSGSLGELAPHKREKQARVSSVCPL